ncbi:hypothetical protein PHET_09958 [Paragonimus heterotremus]|uniref:Uncharacterized protein n=1 Tax=Paragonimus heterotremus TaxID=100268 RepID=A0A8J4WEK6_9TREM|nr:hypothetical protein PHET_09958 [Paragonimus heterotremus]
MVFKLHCSTALYEDVGRHGPLDGFPTFPFESDLSRLKRPIHCSTLSISLQFLRIGEIHDHDFPGGQPISDNIVSSSSLTV